MILYLFNVCHIYTGNFWRQFLILVFTACDVEALVFYCDNTITQMNVVGSLEKFIVRSRDPLSANKCKKLYMICELL